MCFSVAIKLLKSIVQSSYLLIYKGRRKHPRFSYVLCTFSFSYFCDENQTFIQQLFFTIFAAVLILSRGEMSGKKYKVPTLETKIKLLEDVDTTAMTLTEIGEKYGVHKSTVSKIVKNRQQVEEAYTSISFQPDRKRIRTGKMEDMDEVL